MEHAEALERIEIAAAEPDGLDRLMAGDTADAAAVAGHLAGCPACGAELGRVNRTARIARDVIRARADADLRGRTLAFVAANGVQRGPAAAAHAPVGAASAAVAGEPAPPSAVPGVPGAGTPGTPSGASDLALGPDMHPVASPVATEAPHRTWSDEAARRPSRLAWIAALAAAVVVALGVGYLAGTPGRERLDVSERQVALLEATTTAALRVQAQPDATRVDLRATGPGAESGTLLFSPSSGELVMVAAGLAPTRPGDEYGCWVEAGGTRERIGRMYWAGELWTWAGPVEGLDELPPDARFGVSLGRAGGGPDEGEPVLAGGL